MASANVESPGELWKDIAGYEGYYQVSNLGRVKRLERTFFSAENGCLKQTYPEKFIKIRVYKTGYTYVGLCVNAVAKKFKVHRLVALAFVANPENKPHIDHTNAVRGDNRAVNLKWVTQAENQSNPFFKQNASVSKKGDLNPMKRHRKTLLQVNKKTNEIIKVWLGTNEAALALGLQKSGIVRCCAGKVTQCGGYIWRYAE